MRRLVRYTALIICMFTVAAHAASNQERLDEVQRKQLQSKTLTKELKEEIDGLAEEQRRLKAELVELAAELKTKEQSLADTSEQQRIAQSELSVAIEALNARRGELEAMIQAVVRLSQVPPEAMVMMPEMSSDTMQTARTMRIMADTLKHRTQELNAQINALHKKRRTLAALSDKTKSQLSLVEKKRNVLAKKVDERSKLTKQLNQQLGEENTRMKALANEAKNLEQLISLVRKKQQQKETAKIDKSVSEVVAYVKSAIQSGGSKQKMRSFKQMKGKLSAPAAGKIIGRFDKKSTKELSKGMTIATNSGSSVNAAYDGKVAYVGSFRGYGNMVILKHTENYYTLMAGLGDISASANEVLLEGEPVGTMDSSARKLYVELRQSSDPINPKGWFRGL